MEKTRRSHLTDADRAAWAGYAGRIRPLPVRPAMPATPEPSVAPPAPRLPTDASASPVRLAPLAIGTSPGGVDRATWHRFRTGKLPVTRVLDLHGHTVQRAYQSLAAFLHAAQAERLRCVEVVTGQGGVLRRELPLWLNQPELRALVLAAAHPHAANPGAVRLLLRRVR
jgi:DNA-nicking Smr family endonuclease